MKKKNNFIQTIIQKLPNFLVSVALIFGGQNGLAERYAETETLPTPIEQNDSDKALDTGERGNVKPNSNNKEEQGINKRQEAKEAEKAKEAKEAKEAEKNEKVEKVEKAKEAEEAEEAEKTKENGEEQQDKTIYIESCKTNYEDQIIGTSVCEYAPDSYGAHRLNENGDKIANLKPGDVVCITDKDTGKKTRAVVDDVYMVPQEERDIVTDDIDTTVIGQIGPSLRTCGYKVDQNGKCTEKLWKDIIVRTHYVADSPEELANMIQRHLTEVDQFCKETLSDEDLNNWLEQGGKFNTYENEYKIEINNSGDKEIATTVTVTETKTGKTAFKFFLRDGRIVTTIYEANDQEQEEPQGQQESEEPPEVPIGEPVQQEQYEVYNGAGPEEQEGAGNEPTEKFLNQMGQINWGATKPQEQPDPYELG